MLPSRQGWEDVTLLFHALYGLQAEELDRGLIALKHYPTAESLHAACVWLPTSYGIISPYNFIYIFSGV